MTTRDTIVGSTTVPSIGPGELPPPVDTSAATAVLVGMTRDAQVVQQVISQLQGQIAHLRLRLENNASFSVGTVLNVHPGNPQGSEETTTVLIASLSGTGELSRVAVSTCFEPVIGQGVALDSNDQILALLPPLFGKAVRVESKAVREGEAIHFTDHVGKPHVVRKAPGVGRLNIGSYAILDITGMVVLENLG